MSFGLEQEGGSLIAPMALAHPLHLNMVPSDPFMSHLATQLGYSAVEFQALQLIVLASYGVVN